ncbi:hypothetical protein ABPG75_013284 [Micractinium tetrahymenae]
MADLQEQREGLLAVDHLGEEAEEQQQQQQPSAAVAGALHAGSDHSGSEQGEEDAEAGVPASEPERSLLSRAGSITGLPRRAPPPCTRSRFAFCAKTSAWFTGTLLLGVLLSIGLVVLVFPPPGQGGIPSCRSGAALAVLPPGPGSNGSAAQHMVVWSGRGQSGAMYRGLHSFNLSSLSWQKLKDKGWRQQQEQQQRLGRLPQAADWLPVPQQAASVQSQPQQHWWQRWQQRRRPHPPPPPLPAARWQAGVVHVADLGMLVHGGDAPHPASKGKQPPSSNSTGDAWLLRLPELRWQHGCACQYNGSTGECVASAEAPAPSPRRAHSLVSYQDEGGQHALLLFGGRRQDGLLLNDVWKGELSPSGNSSCHFGINWTLLHDPQAGQGTGPAPLPRKGHVAAMQNGSRMVIHGGRSDVYGSFTDVWAFSLASGHWKPLPPARAVQPAPREHHGAALYNGQLFIFGGRYGSGASASWPIGDRWLFDLATREWRQLPIRGLSPLPRFLFSSAQFSPAGGGADQFVVFGGETGSGCKLNDVWRLGLDTLHWEQLSAPVFATLHCRQLLG